jgi:hypothetical protein
LEKKNNHKKNDHKKMSKRLLALLLNKEVGTKKENREGCPDENPVGE